MGGFGIEPKRERTNERGVEGHARDHNHPGVGRATAAAPPTDARSGSFSPLCVVQATDEAIQSRRFPGRQRDYCELTKTRQNQKWQRDPEGMRLRILEAAKEEFAAHGLAGARVDRIAVKAGANKRMLYYHVGKKDELYLTVLEGAYEKIRVEERGLDLEHLDPPKAIERLIEFTWNYFLRNPEFLALLNTENLAKARHLKRSTKVKSMHSPFVEMIRTVVRRGVQSGDFVVAVDPVQLYISIAALCFFYLSNSATLSVIFGRDLLNEEARDERLDHMVALVLAALTGKSFAAFGKKKAPTASVPLLSDAK
jgi:AcrR family transcriptional regulator